MKKKNIILIIFAFVTVILLCGLGIFLAKKNKEEAKDTFQENVKKALEIIEDDRIYRNVTSEYIYTIVDGMIYAGRAQVQKVNGLNGTITYDKNLKIQYAIHNSDWCIVKNKAMSDYEITKYNGICEIGEVEAELASEKCFEFSNGEIINYYEYEENNSKNESCPKEVLIPDFINNEKVTSIGEEAFKNKKITKIVLSDNITTIKAHAFEENNLTELTTNNVEEIKPYAFWNNQLETVVLSDRLKIVDELAFMDNVISSLTIGKKVETIGADAFYNNQLETITIPDNVKTIGVNAFQYNNLKSVVLGTGIETIGNSAFRKMEDSNTELTTIENKSSKTFDFGSVINGESNYNFAKGTVINSYGNVEIK